MKTKAKAREIQLDKKGLTCFPKENGTYLYIIMCRICLLIVSVNSTIQQKRRIGQKTGTSNALKNVNTKAMQKALVIEYLHTGKQKNQCPQNH